MRISALLQMGVALMVTFLGQQTGEASGVVTNCTESALRAALAGGGPVTFGCDGTITLSATISITNNTTIDAAGHQIAISGGGNVGVFQIGTKVQFSIKNLTILDGSAPTGAGLLNTGGTVVVTNCTFRGNKALGAAGSFTNGQSALGGAIANSAVLHLFNCNFTNNNATGGAAGFVWGYTIGNFGGDGAGAAVWNAGLLTASGCTFAANSAIGGTGGQGAGGPPLPWPSNGYPGGRGGDGAGGALFNSGTASLVNCTLASNVGTGGAGGQGGPGYPYSPDYPPPLPGPDGSPGASIGGICDASGQCNLTNCTLVFSSGIGIQTTGTNGAMLINTLLSYNLPGGNASGALADLGHNLSSDLTCAFTNTGSMNNIFPLLGSLANNGGLTPTVALLSGCRAIDAGDTSIAPPIDQRGIARPFGSAADIGAYEYNAENPGPSPIVSECTEQGLLAAMSGGGHITFACDGTITLANAVTVTTNTFLDATGHQIALQSTGATVFVVSPNVVFSIAHITITGGNPGVRNTGGVVNATNCVFSGNGRTLGGAIQNASGEVCLSACVFTNNKSTGEGGAIDNAGTLTADLCTFAANSARGSNGLPGNWWGQSGGPGSDAAGGAIRNLGTATISRSTFCNNSVTGGTGADGYSGVHADPGMSSGGMGGNGGFGGDAQGGALYNAGIANVIDSTFASNSATGGDGGLGGAGGASYGWGAGGPGGNGAQGGHGAGAVFNDGQLRMINSTFTLNSGSPGSGGNGGAGGNCFNGTGGNGGNGGSGGSGAGAIYDQSGVGITNCTFAMNSGFGGTAGGAGSGGYGGYRNGSSGMPGSAGSISGGINSTHAQLANTLLATNLPGGNSTGRLSDLGGNLSSDSSCSFTNAASMNNTDPQLLPLANYGGLTPTMALQYGSPAIDAANDAAAPTADQRGFPRPVWHAVDIGAYEYGSPALLTMPMPDAAGKMDILVIGKRGQPCQLLASENLVDWQPISSNQFASDGTALFHVDANRPQKFYCVIRNEAQAP